jgi:hypothetical protein
MFESRLQTRHWSGRISTRLVQQAALLFKTLPRRVRADAPKLQQEGSVTTYFEWLFLQPIENPQLKLKPALIRAEAQ